MVQRTRIHIRSQRVYYVYKTISSGVSSVSSNPIAKVRVLGLFGNNKKQQSAEPAIEFYPKNDLPEFDEQTREWYIQTRLFVKNAIDSGAETMVILLTAGGVAVQYVIDGVTHPAPGVDRDTGATLMAMLKLVAGLDLNNRTPVQQGEFSIYSRNTMYQTGLVCQLGKNGEQMMLKFDDGTPPLANMLEAGMREQSIEQLKGMLCENGFVLVSAPPHAGFTTTFNLTIRSVDRYIRNVVAVEDEADNEPEIENAPITTYDSKAGEKPITVLPKLLRTYPDVICVRKLADPETVDLLLEQVAEERMVIGGIAAADAVEALMRVLALKPWREKFAQVITASLNVRVVRMLCEFCKQQYLPPPQLLQKLGLPPKKQIAFYRPGPPPIPPDTKPEDAPTICTMCNGIGYKGRSAIFELLVIDDELRKCLSKVRNVAELRKVAKKARHNALIDEGIVAAALGLTSIQEVFRVMKG